MATGFYRQAKHFELKFFIRKAFHSVVKAGGQNHPHRQSICLMPDNSTVWLSLGKSNHR